MKIGEFAKICGTKISVLRHYDKEKLLVPEYTDEFSGYRYYSSEQIMTFHRITALKKAGFTLNEINTILSPDISKEEMISLFGRKENEIRLALENLMEAKLVMTKLDVIFERNEARVSFENKENVNDICRQMDLEIKSADYQRVSQFEVGDGEIVCRVVKLNDESEYPEIQMPFEDDADVVGKWEILGNYAVKEDYYENIFCDKNCFYGDDLKYLYFLPKGESYWCFSWTKGYFIVDGYAMNPVYNEYEIEKRNDATYMLITLREYEASRGGEPTYLSLKKVDSNEYSAESVAKKDDLDKVFEEDARVRGKWRSHSFLGSKSEFPQAEEDEEDLYFKSVEFFENGSCRLVYADAVFEGDDTVVWTKNYVLRKWNWSACEYEIRTLDGVDYMIIQWKSGDYRYGGFDTNYYVMVRA